jgi:hypothetical protein
MEIIMTEDTDQGIYCELDFILKAGWTITRQTNGFRVGPPPGAVTADIPESLLISEVWRVSSFTAYRYFASITKNSSGYILQSMRENGTGFCIEFDIAPNGLSNHRPKPVID